MDEKITAVWALIVSIMALLVSLPLAWIQIVQFRRDRRKVQIYGREGNVPGEWNVVFVTNLSPIPILIDHWELVWRRRKFFFWHEDEPVNFSDDDDLHMTLEPKKRKALELREHYSFTWNPRNKGRVDLWIILHVSGEKKPIIGLVHKTYYA